MAAAAQREDAFVDILRDAFPDVPARAVLGTFEDARRAAVPAHREIHVAVRAWNASEPDLGQRAGADEVVVRIVEGELRSPRRRRVGNDDSGGVLALAERVRALLAGATPTPGRSPLLPRGGRLVAAGDPCAVWEETFLDFAPRAGLARPALATHMQAVGALSAGIATGASQFSLATFSPTPVVGDIVVLQAPGNARRECLGAIVAIASGVATTERAASAAYATGSAVLRLPNALRLDVTAAGIVDERIAGRIVSRDLLGGPHAAIVGAEVIRRALAFAPVREAHARAVVEWLRAWRTAAGVVLADEDGTLLLATGADGARVSSLGFALARLDLAFDVSPIADATAHGEVLA